MNLAVLRRVRTDPTYKALLGAALLLANEGGHTVAYLAELTGIPKVAIRKYTRDARDRRRRDPECHLVYCSIIAGGCDHTRLMAEEGLAICLYCLMPNIPEHPALRIYPGDMPAPEIKPRKVYRPDPRLKGGVA